MSELEIDAGIRHCLRDPAARRWLRDVIARGEVFRADAPIADPTWLGRRWLAITIFDDLERADPGSKALMMQEGLEDDAGRTGRDDFIRPDAGPELAGDD